MIIITGASRGVGKFLFETFTNRGEIVYGSFNQTKPEIEANTKGQFSKVDVTNIDQVSNWIGEIPLDEKLEVINCAGISYNSFAHKADIEQWSKVIEVNVLGTFNVIRSVLPHMRTHKYGRIINFSSVVAQKGTPGVSAYAASKAALWGLTKSISAENGSLNVTINNINLGYSELGMIEQVPEKYMESILAQIPKRELCSKEDLLNTVDYLRNTSYATGTSVDLNGGIV